MCCLRSLDDSDHLRSVFRAGAKAVIIGGGWIGLETAAAARGAGAAVTVLERAEPPLLHILGSRVAKVTEPLQELIRSGAHVDAGRLADLDVPLTQATVG